MITTPMPPTEAADASASLADLYRDRYVPMVRLARLITGSNAVAEELVQDAFVAVHRNWARADAPITYLRTAVVNGCRSWHRRRFLERTRRPDAVREVAADDHPDLREALLRLTPRQRAALVMKFYEDLPEAEIAQALGCRVGTVKSLVSRGLGELRKVVEP